MRHTAANDDRRLEPDSSTLDAFASPDACFVTLPCVEPISASAASALLRFPGSLESASDASETRSPSRDPGNRLGSMAVGHASRRVLNALVVGAAYASLVVGLSGGALAFSWLAWADDAPPRAIRAVDVMGDKGRSALDGFSQAPIPREESAAMDAPNPGGQSIVENRDRPVPTASTPTEPGLDPQTPRPVVLPGPADNAPAGP